MRRSGWGYVALHPRLRRTTLGRQSVYFGGDTLGLRQLYIVGCGGSNRLRPMALDCLGVAPRREGGWGSRETIYQVPEQVGKEQEADLQMHTIFYPLLKKYSLL